MRSLLVAWLGALTLVLLPSAIARAHDPGLSSITLSHLGTRAEVHVIMNNADLSERRRATSAECNAAGVLAISLGAKPLALKVSCRAVDAQHTAFVSAFALVEMGELALRLALFDELPRGHRSFARVLDRQGRVSAQALLSRGNDTLRTRVTGLAPTDFFVLGVEHIVTGLDHLLFLALLILGVDSLRGMAAIVSCFTFAHSLALMLAAVGWLVLPARLVESLIAASIVIVALGNCVAPAAQAERLLVTFGFGLIHGLGFASALSELGVAGATFAVIPPVLQFNLGVEAGQIALGALAIPCFIRLRRLAWSTGVARVLSGMAAAIGIALLVERVLSL
jgi:hypothetical protein